VLANALADDGHDGDRARQRLLAEPALAAPHLADLEVLSVLRRLTATGLLPERRAQLAIDDLKDLALTRFPHQAFTARIWELRATLTPYDAAYVALAETLGCPLLTADARLARSNGPRCGIEVLTL
jgi:predicted nucleic acid-binding protein